MTFPSKSSSFSQVSSPSRSNQLMSYRPIHTSSSVFSSSPSSSSSSSSVNEIVSKLGRVACGGMNSHQCFELTHKILVVSIPCAFLLPNPLAIPFNFALGLTIPYHAYKGMVGVIQDYVPPQYRPATIGVLLAITLFAGYGLVKINMCGPGISTTVKALWADPRDTKAKINAKKKGIPSPEEKAEKVKHASDAQKSQKAFELAMGPYTEADKKASK